MMFLYFPLHGLAMSHACYNPIIYCFMNTRFRDGLYALLRAVPGLNRCVSRAHPGAGFPHAGMEGTESTVLQRNNTCTTYISMKRKPYLGGRISSPGSHQLPIRSVSLRNNGAQNGASAGTSASRRTRYANILDEQI
nr:unnamed protein product [Callosobruchus analis]